MAKLCKVYCFLSEENFTIIADIHPDIINDELIEDAKRHGKLIPLPWNRFSFKHDIDILQLYEDAGWDYIGESNDAFRQNENSDLIAKAEWTLYFRQRPVIGSEDL